MKGAQKDEREELKDFCQKIPFVFSTALFPQEHIEKGNKEFYYGDHNSPMFIDEVWNKIINYFKLTNFEKEAAKKFSSYYKGGGKDYYPDHHVFICSECAEKALGREITDKDINDSLFNIPFREKYFKS